MSKMQPRPEMVIVCSACDLMLANQDPDYFKFVATESIEVGKLEVEHFLATNCLGSFSVVPTGKKTVWQREGSSENETKC